MSRRKGWRAWNVGLWLANDEALYLLVCEVLRRKGTRDAAAGRLAIELSGQVTPDGAPYTRNAIRQALVGWS